MKKMEEPKINYYKICKDLIKDLPQRTKEVVWKRFGFETGKRETLEAIGEHYGITRERVRQIEKDGFSRMEPKLKSCENIFQHFAAQMRLAGELKKEEILLEQWGKKEEERLCLYFLLTLGDLFQRYAESRDFYSLWTINPKALNVAKKVVDSFSEKFEEVKQPLSFDEIFEIYQKEIARNVEKKLNSQALLSYFEVSKTIKAGFEGNFGLKDWAEINPRGVKDKAYLVFKKEKKPLHFKEVARLIRSYFGQEKVFPQTVHNELISDPRFVLVGRGLYALREWGYEPGVVKEVIHRLLQRAKRPLSKEEIIDQVLKQRFVKENTILLNLQNRKDFLRTPEGKYTVKEI